MRAVSIESPGRLGVVEVPEPEPGPGDAVVSIAFSGICGSDVEVFTGRRPADIVRYPVVPGHEWSGVVSAVGDDADPTLVGTKVVGEGFSSCGGCARCADGETVMCETRYDEIGFTRPGAWADELLIPVAQLHPLPTDADLRAAAALEPAACSVDAASRAASEEGERVAVVGGGTIGCLVVQMLRAAPLGEIVVIDPNARARKTAIACGATASVAPSAADDLRGFDAVVEAAGTASSVACAAGLVRRGGRLVLAGIPAPTAVLGAFDLISRRIEVRPVFGAPSAAWSAAVDAFAAGVLDPGVLVTHEFELDAAGDALSLLASGSADVGKVVLRARSH